MSERGPRSAERGAAVAPSREARTRVVREEPAISQPRIAHERLRLPMPAMEDAKQNSANVSSGSGLGWHRRDDVIPSGWLPFGHLAVSTRLLSPYRRGPDRPKEKFMKDKERWTQLLAEADEAKANVDANLEELNATISNFETALNSRKFGVHGWVTLETNTDEGSGVTWSRGLAYRKRGKKWCLLIEAGIDDDPDNWSSEELIHAGRDTRYEAIKHFSELLEDIIDNLRTRVDQQRAAIAEAGELANVLLRGSVKGAAK
jgi:hypothetical protein